ncbi:hypothetical protein IscW_ISCW001093 [Ixodes scapularis]|uniref:Uncharacterized protein n=1 Tax=Ixodes scapularis TaxID=6945 RepID=B7P6X6_IXOSC|nr:hypothetical protein IscW_ISCW001093 [Ixodes scapularis]|eukprot:XP_002409353.1 hypothetical protein IscW_ISCW001093 [Ixodes scapularis]
MLHTASLCPRVTVRSSKGSTSSLSYWYEWPLQASLHPPLQYFPFLTREVRYCSRQSRLRSHPQTCTCFHKCGNSAACYWLPSPWKVADPEMARTSGRRGVASSEHGLLPRLPTLT